MAAIAEAPVHPLAILREQMERREAEFAAALPAHIPVERFRRMLLSAVERNPDLLDADRQSLWDAAMQSARDGLAPDGREGAIVICTRKERRKGRECWIRKAQWLPMVSGILRKIRDSGEVAMITARVVYGGDTFRHWIDERGEHVFHEPADEPNTDVVRRVFAMARTTDGALHVERLTRKEIERIRAAGKTKDHANDEGPRIDWREETARRSAVRRLARHLPMPPDLDDLIRRDDALRAFDGAREEANSGHGRPTLNDMLDRVASKPMDREPDEQPGSGIQRKDLPR